MSAPIRLDMDNSDHELRRIASSKRGLDWRFKNCTDLNIKIYRKGYLDKVDLVGMLDSRETLIVPVGILREGDIMYVAAKGSSKDQLLFTPFRLRDEWKEIDIGAVRHDTNGDNQANKLYTNISQLHVNNHYIFPIEVVVNGQKIADIGGEDGNGYFANSRSSKIVDNKRQGFLIGDKVDFYMKGTKKIVGSITLKDNFSKSLKVGIADAAIISRRVNFVI